MKQQHSRSLLLFLFFVLVFALRSYAHVGNNDVYQTLTAGPYKLFVTVRTPTVLPGIVTVEVRSSGTEIHSLTVTPLPLTGEASMHPPSADAMKASSEDPAFFTGSLWIMGSGSWQIRFGIDGNAGTATGSIPVAAVSTKILRMQKPLGVVLGALGLVLVLGIVGIAAAAVRESRLKPGSQPDPLRRRKSLVAGASAFLFAALIVYFGGKWWNVEAAGYAADVHRNAQLHPTLSGSVLNLSIDAPDPEHPKEWKQLQSKDLLLDHGHLMHLYAIRWPEMDAVFHLHPEAAGDGLAMTLPSMPPGSYRLFGDIVFADGFPETETAMLTIPAAFPTTALGPEDASAAPPKLSAGDLGPAFRLPDGYTMIWDKPAALSANTAYSFRFQLVDAAGKPATDMQPYLGMAGHAAFVKTDGTAFAHTHPDGSAAMAAVMLANASMTVGNAPDTMSMTPQTIGPVVEFPYGFPSEGRYRIFIQMKHAGTIETGVFDAEVK